MSKTNESLVSLVFLLVFSSIISPKLMVFGSTPVHERIIKRPNPLLRHFKDYIGVYNVTNTHYWASTAFTGIHGFAMSAVWTFCGLYLAILIMIKNLRSNNESSSSSSSSWYTAHSERYVLFSFLLLTLLAMVAASSVIAANQICLQRTKKLKSTLLSAEHDITKSIQILIAATTRMQFYLHAYDRNITLRLNMTTRRLGNESRIIQDFVTNHEHALDVAIQVPYIAHLVVAIVNLLLLIAALVLLLLHWHSGFIFIILLCWILTVVSWFLTGFDFFLHILAKDTCSTLKEFVQAPQHNSLNSILPCMNSTKSEQILTEIGSTIHFFIGKLNSKLTKVYESMGTKGKSFEQVLGYRMICDPFPKAPRFNYEPEVCDKDSIPIPKIPDIILKFTCYNQNSSKACLDEGKVLHEHESDKALAYSYSVESLLNVFPDLQNLTQCATVKNAFSEISLHQCRPFRKTLLWQWSSILSLSISMVFLELTLVLKICQKKRRNMPTSTSTSTSINQRNVAHRNVQ